MRKFLQNSCGCLLLFAIILCGVFLFILLHAPAFENGEFYTFYLGANSSSLAVVSENPMLDKLTLDVQGESVQYAGNRLGELQQKYRAELLFTEKASGVTNYYFFSPCFRSAVELNGQAVNLHIAVSEKKTVVGTPLIFGGF